ncbi:Uncharacterised protein g4971 [Pycnogonum litorale]
MGSSPSTTKIIKSIMNLLIYDIKPDEDKIKLQSSAQNKYVTKNHKKVMLQHNQGLNHQLMYHHANADVCLAALQALDSIICALGATLPADSSTGLHDLLVSLLLSVQQQPDNSTVPYKDCRCRMMLYNVFQSLVVCGKHQSQIPVQSAINMFINGLKDNSFEVHKVCQKALSVCDVIIHPRLPTLGIKHIIQKQQTSETTDSSQNTRVAHESTPFIINELPNSPLLYGQNDVAVQRNETEMVNDDICYSTRVHQKRLRTEITVEDEPSVKRHDASHAEECSNEEVIESMPRNRTRIVGEHYWSEETESYHSDVQHESSIDANRCNGFNDQSVGERYDVRSNVNSLDEDSVIIGEKHESRSIKDGKKHPIKENSSKVTAASDDEVDDILHSFIDCSPDD